MKIRCPLLLLFPLGLALMAGCNARKTRPETSSLAVVNGEAISSKDFYGALRVAYGGQIMEKLVEQKVILQEAARQKVELSKDEEQALYKTQENEPDEDMQRIARNQLRTSMLARKLILHDVGEERLKKTFDQFKNDLTQYEVFQIIVVTPEDAAMVKEALRTGTKFDQVALTTSIDKVSARNGGKRGFMTAAEIRASYPPEIRDVLTSLKPNEISAPCKLKRGFIFFRMGEVRTTYPQIKPTVEELYVQAHAADFMYRLLSTAKVESPFLPKASVSLSPTPVPGALPTGAPGQPGLPPTNPSTQTLPTPQQRPLELPDQNGPSLPGGQRDNPLPDRGPGGPP